MEKGDIMKSDRQSRAENAAARFKTDARRPVVIEFAGVPKAGKTSTIAQLQNFFKRCGFRVQVVIERASVCPIRDKKHFTFNVWTAATTLAQILQNTQEPPREEDPQILILDRGLFDSISWLTMMDHLSRIQTEDRKAVENFLLLDEWRRRVTGVIVMTVSPQDAMEREVGFLPVEGGGSIMNAKVLEQMLHTTKECMERMKTKFNIFHIDTSGKSKDGAQKTAEVVADHILDLIEQELQEDILHLPKERVARLFGESVAISGDTARALLDAFADGQFAPREKVEADGASVQALPVVVVRNRSGQILVLRRRERKADNKLHEKLVIWAGGHVRKEDGNNGRAILSCAQRELKEELRLNVEAEELKFIGAVFADVGDKTARHVALVYEWFAQTDDVAVTLSAAEFFERRGTSLSGKFKSLEELTKDLGSDDSFEVWSTEILHHLLGGEGSSGQQRLF
jgi:predicted NUDIX family phosphoesterase